METLAGTNRKQSHHSSGYHQLDNTADYNAHSSKHIGCLHEFKDHSLGYNESDHYSWGANSNKTYNMHRTCGLLPENDVSGRQKSKNSDSLLMDNMDNRYGLLVKNVVSGGQKSRNNDSSLIDNRDNK